MDLGKFTVTDFFTPQTQFPEVIRTVLGTGEQKGTADGEKLFSLSLEGQPLSGESDYTLKVTSHPLEVVANVPLLERLRTYFLLILSYFFFTQTVYGNEDFFLAVFGANRFNCVFN